MNSRLVELGQWGQVHMHQIYKDEWSITFKVPLVNGNTLELESGNHKTPEDALIELNEKIIASELTANGKPI